MYALKGLFKRIEFNALNESTRKYGDPIPNQKMTELINTITDEQ